MPIRVALSRSGPSAVRAQATCRAGAEVPAGPVDQPPWPSSCNTSAPTLNRPSAAGSGSAVTMAANCRHVSFSVADCDGGSVTVAQPRISVWCGTVHDIDCRVSESESESEAESDRQSAKAFAAARDANDRPIEPGYGPWGG